MSTMNMEMNMQNIQEHTRVYNTNKNLIDINVKICWVIV